MKLLSMKILEGMVGKFSMSVLTTGNQTTDNSSLALGEGTLDSDVTVGYPRRSPDRASTPKKMLIRIIRPCIKYLTMVVNTAPSADKGPMLIRIYNQSMILCPNKRYM